MKRTHEKERIAALSAGLAVIILLWIGAQAFFSDWMESSEALSIWFYGPVSAAAWGLLSLIAYGLIIRAQRRNPALCHEHEEALREKRLAKTGDLSKVPCASKKSMRSRRISWGADGRICDHDRGMARDLLRLRRRRLDSGSRPVS